MARPGAAGEDLVAQTAIIGSRKAEAVSANIDVFLDPAAEKFKTIPCSSGACSRSFRYMAGTINYHQLSTRQLHFESLQSHQCHEK